MDIEEESVVSDEAEDLLDIHQAIIDGDVAKLSELCEQGGRNLNGKFMDDLDSQHLNMTPLALAAALDKVDLVETLLKYGVDVDATFANLKTTALMTSSFHGHANVVKILLNYGADVAKTDVQKSTALGYCFGGSRSVPVVTFLLRAGIDVNISNVLGMNAFLLVSGYGNEDLLQMVLKAGANVKDVANNFGHSPLHLAVLGKQSQIDLITSRNQYNTAYYGLNRKNMKSILMDWVRDNHSGLLNGWVMDSSIEKAGQFLEEIGSKMINTLRKSSEEQWTEEEVMKHKVDAAARYRTEKLTSTTNNKKSGLIDSLLSCGGKLGKQNKGGAPKVSNMFDTIQNTDQTLPLPDDKELEVQAICTHFAKCLRLLLDAGCQIDEPEYTFGLTPLDIAMLNGDTESIALLLSCGADNNHLMKMLAMTDLYTCLATDRPDKKQLKTILDFDPHLDINASFENANIPTRLSESENDDMLGDVGLTPIAVAAKVADNSTVDVIKLLIKHGANPNLVGKGRRTALGEACRWGNVKMVEFLLGQGADIEQPNPAFKNATPLGIAVLSKQPATVQILISKGAFVDHVMEDGRTSLISAFDAEDMAMVECLLESNPSSNFLNKNGFESRLVQQYKSADKDTRLILQTISGKSLEIKAEEERLAREKEDKEDADKKVATDELRSKYNSVFTSSSYEESMKSQSGIYEEIKLDSDAIPASIIPKIRKKKKKSTKSSESDYEIIGKPQVKTKTANIQQEIQPELNNGDAIYSEVKKPKTSTRSGNIFGGAKHAAVGMLEQNAEEISETVASGISRVVGEDKKQTIKSVAQPVIQTAVGFAKKFNGQQESTDDGGVRPVEEDDEKEDEENTAASFPEGVPISLNENHRKSKSKNKNYDNDDVSKNLKVFGDAEIESEINNAVKKTTLQNNDLMSEDVDTVAQEVKPEKIPTKKKKRSSHKEKPEALNENESVCSELKQNLEALQLHEETVDQVNNPLLSLDSIDSAIVKPKARHRKTKQSTGSEYAETPGVSVTPEIIEESHKLKADIALPSYDGAGDALEMNLPEVQEVVSELKVKKKKKVKTTSLTVE